MVVVWWGYDTIFGGVCVCVCVLWDLFGFHFSLVAVDAGLFSRPVGRQSDGVVRTTKDED
ncbi:hypothetical protein B9Z19DRAFT_1076746 [Tuber borchii]|uniref:Transmembrane protein n=1 Tax=Tuber borchii TaxID=42251 RepID=A0A2T7A1C4_TUBBO|nr:hypothetical protein B9Z19DRAFT_1076746 [Tuber borchii]